MVTVITAQNGRLPANVLTRVRTGQPLRHACANSYNRLDAHMRASGQGALTLSAGLSGYRTLADQQHMRNIGLTTIAVGRSPHGEGVAADFQGLGGLNGVRYRWLRNNAGPFGWFHPGWAQAGGSNPSPHHWEYDQRRDTGAGQGGDDDMPSAQEVAAAVWGFALNEPTGPVASAARYLVDSRVLLGDPSAPMVRVADQVWSSVIDRPNGPNTDAGTYLVDTRVIVGPVDRGPVPLRQQVWDFDIDRPGTPTSDAGSYLIETAVATGAVEPELHHHHAHEQTVHLSDEDVHRIAVAVAELLGVAE